ncbi:MAG: alpha/beta fold hydrolase [Thermoguttaceae bacterium]|jgi:pimeloyl-ACP methyl ester carboxylesterase
MNTKPAPPRHSSLALLLALLLATAGCTQKWVTLRSVPRNPLGEQLQLTSYGGPQPSPRTEQLLRVYNLTDDLKGDPRLLLEKFQKITERERTADKVYALSELAYLGGKKTEGHDRRKALDLYGASVLHAYDYLFDARLARTRNCYDPQFRGACELYNGGLEAALRIICRSGELLPGTTKTIHTATGSWDVTCALRAEDWQPKDFERFEFVSDYEMKGLKNKYQTHGLGVPLIAVRHGYPGEPAAARYYPADLSFPVTAFLRPQTEAGEDGGMSGSKKGLLELYDPLLTTDTTVGPLHVPLESDLTTPLAYCLSKIPMEQLATEGLFRPEKLLAPAPGQKTPLMGLYMVQPYQPGKIPVLLVHGLWSSPMTWMEMFNDLRSSLDIRRHYQFWFYLYPTGQPFWISAARLRHDLAEARQVLDPQRREPALDQMVLVGHSMGGLVSKLQTLPSGGDYWNLASHLPLDQVRTDAETREKLQDVFYFQPNPSIRRVVTIATPHRGSTFSNQTTQYLLDKLIRLPSTLVNSQQELFRHNPQMLFDHSLLKIETSIDSLSPGSPIFPVMLSTHTPPWVKYHNIIGVLPANWLVSHFVGSSDGVVSESSARVDGVASELIVPADHMMVHCHPLAVMEVRRILHEHLTELRGYSANGTSMPWATGAGVLR